MLPTGREADTRSFREESLPVSHNDVLDVVVEWITATSGERTGVSLGLTGSAHAWEPDVWRKTKEFGVSTALDMVEADAVAEDMRVVNSTPVILDLRVVLPGGLRSQQIRAGSEIHSVNGWSECRLHPGRGINNIRACDGIGNRVSEMRISETDAVRPIACREVGPSDIYRRAVNIGKRTVAVLSKGRDIAIGVVRSPEKRSPVGFDVPVQPPNQHVLTEGRIESS